MADSKANGERGSTKGVGGVGSARRMRARAELGHSAQEHTAGPTGTAWRRNGICQVRAVRQTKSPGEGVAREC